jgi:hypothetical protein
MVHVEDAVESWSGCLIQYSEDDASWDECSTLVTSLDHSGGERITGEQLPFNADTFCIGVGARQPLSLNFRILFQNSPLSFWQTIWDAYEDNSDFYFRWFPGGGNEGDIGIETGAGRITAIPLPAQGEASNAAPLTVEFTLFVDEVHPVVYASS